MYNSNKPSSADLPSTVQLLRSTLLALIAATVLLVTVILPAEYAIDPTGVGRLLGLTEMGEIKEQLAEEAVADRLVDQKNSVIREDVNDSLLASEPVQISAEVWRDEVRIELAPAQGAEVKLSMVKGGTATYTWFSEGGPVNFDLHGDGGGRSISYEKGRGVPGEEGELVAAFDGNHGWFFRNRNNNKVAVVLRTGGEYKAVKRVL